MFLTKSVACSLLVGLLLLILPDKSVSAPDPSPPEPEPFGSCINMYRLCSIPPQDGTEVVRLPVSFDSNPNQESWYSLTVTTSGQIKFFFGFNPSAYDVNFRVWGPFSSVDEAKTACTTGGINPGVLVDFSTDPTANPENVEILNAVEGETYVMIVHLKSGDPSWVGPAWKRSWTSAATMGDIGCPTVTEAPSDMPSEAPSESPSDTPSESPSDMPSEAPSESPSDMPSESPSEMPSDSPSDIPSESPSSAPSTMPSESPSDMPSVAPSEAPSAAPSAVPSVVPSVGYTPYPTTKSGKTPAAPKSTKAPVLPIR